MLRITIPQQGTLHHPANVLPLQLDMPEGGQKTFDLSVDVFLKDCCPYQNVYFSRYLEWQGMCRERFLAERILPEVAFDGIFLTKCAHQEFLDETYAFQRISVLLNTFQVRHCSSFLLFRFMVEETLIGAGYQQIVCAGVDRQITRFPDEIYRRAKEYEIASNEIAMTH